MGVPTSAVGYTAAMSRREDHEVHRDMWTIYIYIMHYIYIYIYIMHYIYIYIYNATTELIRK